MSKLTRYLLWFGGAGVWIVIFFVRAVFGGRVEQCLVKLEISSGDVEVVIPFDVFVHKVRLNLHVVAPFV